MSDNNIYKYGQYTGSKIDEDGYIFDHSVYTGKRIDDDGYIFDHSVYTGKRIDDDGYIFDHSACTGKRIDEAGRVLDQGSYTGTRVDGWKSGAKAGAATGAIAGAAIGAFPAGALVGILIIILSLCCSWDILGDSFSIESEEFWIFWFPFFTMILFSSLTRMSHFNSVLYKDGSKGDIILIKVITNFLILNIIWIIEIVYSAITTDGFWIALIELPCLYFAFSSGILVFMLPYTILSALTEGAFLDRSKKAKGVVPAFLFLLAAVTFGFWEAFNIC